MSNESSVQLYSKSFVEALEFSQRHGISLDSTPVGSIPAHRVMQAVHEISAGLYEQIQQHKNLGRDPFWAIGGDCGNVHFLAQRFLLVEYPDLSPNLVMGSVALDGRESFSFSQDKFIDWLDRGYGAVFDCHAWVSLGADWIIDATIGTWIHTRQGPGGAFGGVAYGRPMSFRSMPIANEKHTEQSFTNIKYKPIVLGMDAFSKVHQARQRSRGDDD